MFVTLCVGTMENLISNYVIRKKAKSSKGPKKMYFCFVVNRKKIYTESLYKKVVETPKIITLTKKHKQQRGTK